MRGNFDASLERVLLHEGGRVDNPKDPGGRTAYGVTQKVYDAWRIRNGLPKRDVWLIEPHERSAIYRSLYWDAIKGDELPAGVDYCAFDLAVNSGTNRAARFLQRAVGVAEDGKIGPVTLAAVKGTPPSLIVDYMCDERMCFLRALGTFEVFGKGWTRRVSDVRDHAKGMCQ